MSEIEILRRAYRRKNLTLYLGAGVSMGSGLPSWEALVVAMYFKVFDEQQLGPWRPFPNYLLAIAEWQRAHLQEPLDISARKIRSHYQEQKGAFRHSLWTTLYEGFQPSGDEQFRPPNPTALRQANTTLNAITQACRGRGNSRIKSIVTYNYDSLLESALEDAPHKAIYRANDRAARSQVPIYHVHGYVPLDETDGSSSDNIVFTEDQYNRIANDPYSWENLVQLHSMSSNVGLMIGLSLSDRNMRRLLDAVRRTPLQSPHFALLQRPKWEPPSRVELEGIHKRAKEYFDKFRRSGVKRSPGQKGPDWRRQIAGILKEVENKSLEQYQEVLHELGIEPIWYKQHSEIPGKLRQIFDN